MRCFVLFYVLCVRILLLCVAFVINTANVQYKNSPFVVQRIWKAQSAKKMLQTTVVPVVALLSQFCCFFVLWNISLATEIELAEPLNFKC